MPIEARVALAKVILHYLQHEVVCETLLLDAIQKTNLSQEAIRHAVHVAHLRQNPQMLSQLLPTVQQQPQPQLSTNDTTTTTIPNNPSNNNNRIRSTTNTTTMTTLNHNNNKTTMSHRLSHSDLK